MDRYSRTLFALLCAIIVFEGFDVALAAIVLPYVGRDFGVGAGPAGHALALASGGAIAAFFAIRLADRYGRRPVLIAAVAGFAAFSLATAFSRTLGAFAALQFCARILLVTQVTVAYILLTEVLPAARRGRANGFMAAFGSLGGALPALLLGFFLEHGLGWRGMFALGGLPLLLVPALWLVLRESEAFQRARQSRPGGDPGLVAQLASVLTPELRRRFLGLSALWFVINFASATTMSFFTWYVLKERGWNPVDLRVLAPIGLALSFAGYVLAGLAMDRIGRRLTALIYLLGSTATAVLCYRAKTHWVIGACYVLLQALQGIWPVAYVYTSELLPTELRAAGSGLANNLLGRWGQVIAPAIVGSLAARLGSVGAAVVPLTLVSLLALPLLRWVLPESARAAGADGTAGTGRISEESRPAPVAPPP